MSDRYAEKIIVRGRAVHSNKNLPGGAPTSKEFWAQDVDDGIIRLTTVGAEYVSNGKKYTVPWTNIAEAQELDGVPEKVAAMAKKSGNDGRGARQ